MISGHNSLKFSGQTSFLFAKKAPFLLYLIGQRRVFAHYTTFYRYIIVPNNYIFFFSSFMNKNEPINQKKENLPPFLI
jgi:hypothetical protein